MTSWNQVTADQHVDFIEIHVIDSAVRSTILNYIGNIY